MSNSLDSLLHTIYLTTNKGFIVTREEATEIFGDAVGHFYSGWSIKENQLILNNLYNRGWTKDKSVDEVVYLMLSEELLLMQFDYDNGVDIEPFIISKLMEVVL